MLKPTIRLSAGGFIAAGLFLLLAFAVFAWLSFSAANNPADSGESGVLLLPFAMPWVMIVPESWLGPLAGVACILLNALILYFLFSGLRSAK